MKKLFDEIGPLLAGFQIAVSVVGFFGIGAVAKWILNHWFPFTRWIWGEFFSFLSLPEITSAEKDALTTFAFFAPMAISSFLSWWTKDQPLQNGEMTYSDDAKEIRLRIYATLIGASFMVIVGGSVIQDAVTLFTTENSAVSTTEPKAPLLNIEAFARIGLFAIAMLIIGLITIFIYWLTQRNQRLSQATESLFKILGRHIKPVKSILSSAATGLASSIISMLASLVSFGTMFGGIILAANQLGPIRTAAPILVLISLLATIFLNPARLLKTGGVVIALVLASAGWDAAVWVAKAVESAPI